MTPPGATAPCVSCAVRSRAVGAVHGPHDGVPLRRVPAVEGAGSGRHEDAEDGRGGGGRVPDFARTRARVNGGPGSRTMRRPDGVRKAVNAGASVAPLVMHGSGKPSVLAADAVRRTEIRHPDRAGKRICGQRRKTARKTVGVPRFLRRGPSGEGATSRPGALLGMRCALMIIHGSERRSLVRGATGSCEDPGGIHGRAYDLTRKSCNVPHGPPFPPVRRASNRSRGGLAQRC